MILKRRFDLNPTAIGHSAIVDRSAYVIQLNVEFRCRNNFADIADQAAVDREPPVREFGLEHSDTLKNEAKSLLDLLL